MEECKENEVSKNEMTKMSVSMSVFLTMDVFLYLYHYLLNQNRSVRNQMRISHFIFLIFFGLFGCLPNTIIKYRYAILSKG